MQYSRDLDDADRDSVANAAKEGLTVAQFAAQMNLHPDQVWKYLTRRGNERLLRAFHENEQPSN